ncbi:Gfo/Idh/MocA family protein [Cetobacterium sp.]|uniref:Gfo/Idh/MocA family protein n=1 Tax=Cetobacterium sp. TaxID=2071632 RepID=UPI003F36C09A
MKKLNVGIVGCGVISSVHIPLILKKNNLVAVCDINQKKAKEIASQNNCSYYKDYFEMLKKEKLDVVHILTPHNIRYDVIKEAVKNNTHIIIEKPLAFTYEEAEKINNLLDKNPNIEATVIYQNRRNETYLKLKNELSKKNLGKILGIEATVFWRRDLEYYKESSWRGKNLESGGGLLINQAIHTLDWMQDIGGEINNTTGIISKLKNKNIEVEDTASINIEFENGIVGFFSGTLCNSINSSVLLNVICEKGNYTIRNGNLYLYNKDKEELISSDIKGEIKDYYGASHEKEIYNFYNSLGNIEKTYFSVKESMKSLKIVTDIYKKGMIK